MSSVFDITQSIRFKVQKVTTACIGLASNTYSKYPNKTPARTPLGFSSRGVAFSCGDSLAFRLLLALGAGDRAPRGAGDLGNDAFLLVFGQVLDQRFVGVFKRR